MSVETLETLETPQVSTVPRRLVEVIDAIDKLEAQGEDPAVEAEREALLGERALAVGYTKDRVEGMVHQLAVDEQATRQDWRHTQE